MSPTQTALETALDLMRMAVGHVPLVDYHENSITRDTERINRGAEGQATFCNATTPSLFTRFLNPLDEPARRKYEEMLKLRAKSDSTKADIAMAKASEQDALLTIGRKEVDIERLRHELEPQGSSEPTKAQKCCLKCLVRERDAAGKTKRKMSRLIKFLKKENDENLRSFGEVVMELQDMFPLPKGNDVNNLVQDDEVLVQDEDDILVQDDDEMSAQEKDDVSESGDVQRDDLLDTTKEADSAKSPAYGQSVEVLEPNVHVIAGKNTNLELHGDSLAVSEILESCLPKAKSINIAVDDTDKRSTAGAWSLPVKQTSNPLSIDKQDSGVQHEGTQGSQNVTGSEDIRIIEADKASEIMPDRVKRAIQELERAEKSYWVRKEQYEEHYKSFDKNLEIFRSLNPNFSRQGAEAMFGPHFLEVGYNLSQRLTRADIWLKKARIEAKEAGVNNCNSWDQESSFLSVDGEGPQPEVAEFVSDARNRELFMEWLEMPEIPRIIVSSEIKFATSEAYVDPWESHSSRGDSSKRRKIEQNVPWVTPNDSGDSRASEVKELQKIRKQPHGSRGRPRARSEENHSRLRSSFDTAGNLVSPLPLEDHSVWMKRQNIDDDVIMIDD